MKFSIQFDSQFRTKSYSTFGLGNRYFIKKINTAIEEIKKKTRPYRITISFDDGTARTLMLYEGKHKNHFLPSKKINLVKVGTRTYIPKNIMRRTTIKRKTK